MEESSPPGAFRCRQTGRIPLDVGPDLFGKQAKLDELQLTKVDIKWYLTQGAKDATQLLSDKHIPQEDIAPALFLPSLPATPAPAALTVLPSTTPLSALKPLTQTPPTKSVSPIISELATPLAQTFEQLKEEQPMPKHTPMDISPPATTILAISDLVTSQPTLAPIIQQITPDAQMTDVQRACIDEVLLECQLQEQQALKELHAMRQHSRAAEVALQLECTKLQDAELQAQHSQQQLAAHTHHASATPSVALVSSLYVPPSQWPGSEASEAAKLSSNFAPKSLSSIPVEI